MYINHMILAMGSRREIKRVVFTFRVSAKKKIHGPVFKLAHMFKLTAGLEVEVRVVTRDLLKRE